MFTQEQTDRPEAAQVRRPGESAARGWSGDTTTRRIRSEGTGRVWAGAEGLPMSNSVPPRPITTGAVETCYIREGAVLLPMGEHQVPWTPGYIPKGTVPTVGNRDPVLVRCAA